MKLKLNQERTKQIDLTGVLMSVHHTNSQSTKAWAKKREKYHHTVPVQYSTRENIHTVCAEYDEMNGETKPCCGLKSPKSTPLSYSLPSCVPSSSSGANRPHLSVFHQQHV